MAIPTLGKVLPVIAGLESSKDSHTFYERHMVEISLIISTLVQFIFSPLTVTLGILAGVHYQMRMSRDQEINPNEKILTLGKSLIAMVGAFSSVIRMFPAGNSGGYIFAVLPYLAAFSTGTALYRGYKYCCQL